jgi:hypothetical protein
MTRIHSNNFSTTLNGAIDNSTTSVVIASSTGFPSVGGGVTTNITVQEGSTVEIMKVTSRSSNTLTVVRAQEGTSASAFSDASTVEIRFTRDSVDTKQDILDGLALTAVTAASSDKFLMQDASDSDNIKTATPDGIVDAAIAGSATVATGDLVVFQDISDSNNYKTATAQSIANLAPAPAESAVTFTDITTNNASTTKHGYLKKLSNSATEYMDGTGNWSTPAGGGGGGGWVLLSTQTASSSTDLHFDSTLITSSYESYVFVVENLRTSATTLINMSISVDNGSTDAGGGDWYSQASIFVFNGSSSIGGISAGTVSSKIGTRDSVFYLSGGVNTNNGASDLTSGTIFMHGPSSPSAQFEWNMSCSATGAVRNHVTGCGQNIAGYTPPINYVKILPGSGNFTSGTIRLYGIQKV